MRLTLVAICLVLLRPVVIAQTEFELIGVVRAPDQGGLAGVTVKVIGGDFRITGNSGEFRIPISRAKIGHRVTLHTYKKGWLPANVAFTVPADPTEDPVRITLKPLAKSFATNSKRNADVKAPERSAVPPELAQVHKLIDIATTLKGRGINDESLKKYQAALAVARQSKFQKEEMECLSQIGNLQMILGKVAQAREFFKSSQSLALKLKLPRHFNWALLKLGDLESVQGNKDLARQHYDKGAALYASIGMQAEAAECLKLRDSIGKKK